VVEAGERMRETFDETQAGMIADMGESCRTKAGERACDQGRNRKFGGDGVAH